MKTTRNWLLSGLLLLVASTVFAQGKITGTIVDEQLGSGIPAVNITINGTTTGTSSDMEGKFTIESSVAKGQLIITFIGFEKKSVNFTVQNGQTVDLGSIKLVEDTSELDEVIVVGRGIIDLAKDRKTPIAVSTIKAKEISEKIGTSDITQTMVNTPSVYVSGQAGGFGDSRISVRGFQQDNTAFLLNGQPINGMEDGKIYWSNWSGMADIANAIQIQRGLGSSKLAISSVGGTVNFVTKATDLKQGGFASVGLANDNYYKSTVGYNTGMNENGWGASVLLSHWQGDGYNNGTYGEGQNYFISVGYKANDKHSFNFLLTGAPQQHDQNFSKKISDYLGFGRKYNNNYGYLNGNYVSERVNFYHKPVANLNWDFKISDKTELSTVLYASWGRGGGTGNYGSSSNKKYVMQTNPVTGLSERTAIDYDQIYANNQALTDGAGNAGNSYLIRSSVNNHAWYGVVSNLKHQLTENLVFNAGLDLRTYDGTHFRQVENFMGLTNFTDTRNLRGENHQGSGTMASNVVTQNVPVNPWQALFNTTDENQRLDYDYSEKISYGGVFGQLEYSNNNFSAFFQGSLSSQSHQRFDRYDYLPQFEDSEKVNNTGYNVKAGGNYNIDQNNSFYVNAGYYNRQPYHDNIYLNYTNEVNPLASNEKILGLEAGYSFKSSMFTANLNGYRTTWEDRVVSSSRTVTNAAGEMVGTTTVAFGDLIYKSNLGVKQVHTGLELDFILRPIDKLDIKGFASIGNWEYEGNAVTRQTDENQNLLKEETIDVDGGKVGDAAQTTWGLGAKYEILTRLSVDADWRTYNDLYGNNGAVKENIMLPNYDLVDAGVSYKFILGQAKTNSITVRLNVNNVFDEVYLSELSSNIKVTDNIPAVGNTPSIGSYQANGRVYKGIADGNQGYFGFGRTWNFSLKYNF
ncbi:carboxypeptidase-like regulatory domain-containing protein [Flavobacterium antarcticum]|uniref:TonB-dependent receptor n=1 Tax=Flavobacterium antarcticum TaxID=271155 RepID=UPI0003B6997D|nr:carboxypeptidase-like regulatory domain-containing protein [Flavobacterium antarcticum]